MLSWITGAGAKGSEDGTIPHCDSFIEAPETPAPVFAVRAFKHALFGTPKPLEAETHDRFDDIASTMKPKASGGTSSEHAPVTQPKHNIARNSTLPDDLGLSPSKPNGILMTPGTTRRNKTVTFGAQVVDNEGKKAGRSGLPNTCPGKFPSPWTPKPDIDGLSETSTGSQKRTKLTQTLHDVRDSSRSNKMSERAAVKSKDDLDITLDFSEPRSQSGRYWKQEYYAYAENTQREVKKLLMKHKSAKDFAKTKDAEVVDLTEKLRQETLRAERLESRTKELEKEVALLKAKSQQGGAAGPFDDLKSAQNEAARLRLENWKLREDLGRGQTKTPSAQPSPRRRPLPAGNADIWADAVLSSPFIADATSPTPKKIPSPLGHRDINTLQASIRSSQSKAEDQAFAATPKHSHKKSLSRVSREPQTFAEDTLELSLALPQPSPEPVRHSSPRSAARTPRSSRRTAADKSIDDLLERYSPSKSIMMSSPPPAFDRMALPIGMPSADSAASNTQRKVQRKKPTLTESFAQAASPHVDKAATGLGNPADSANGKADGGRGQKETEDGKVKRELGEERKRAALERIAARRLRTSKAA